MLLNRRTRSCCDAPPNLVESFFAQDVRFKALAEDWQRQGKSFAGLLFGNQLAVTVGTYVKDLELIAKATDPAEWTNIVQHLPL